MFVVYSKDGCPYCDKVAGLLQWLELKHVIYKLDRDFTKESFIAEYGDSGSFPQVTFNDKSIGGCAETIQFVREQKHLPEKAEE
jgi:glutaredoxin